MTNGVRALLVMSVGVTARRPLNTLSIHPTNSTTYYIAYMNSSMFFLLKALLNSQLLGLNLLWSAFALKQQKLTIVEKTSRRRQTSTIGYPTRLALVGLAGTLIVTEPVLALPQGGQVLEGKAKIQQVNPDQLNINQQSDRAVINWQGFSVGDQQQVNFQQPSATSATLNRVTGNERSNITGRVTANGQVMFVNPNGIVFGPSAQIDVAGLMATTLDIGNKDFMNGRYSFQAVRGKPGATVENFGQITVKEGGFAALVAPGVSNSGVINARLGKVVLASGTQATLDFSGDGLLSVAVDPAVAGQLQGANGQPLSSLVNQSGLINADGGVVTLSARAGGAVVDSAINMSGVIQARSLSNQQGEIVLSGEEQGKVIVTGTLDTSGTAVQSGGNISVFSDGAIDTSKGSLNTSSDTGYGGVITLAATNNITTGNITATGAENNGTIDLYSQAGNINTTAGSLNGGAVSLDAATGITTGTISSSSSVGDGGDISLVSDGAIDTSKGSLNSSSDTGYGGAITLASNSNITTGNITATGTEDNGTIDLYSIKDKVNTTAGSLNGGAITLYAEKDIQTGNVNSRSATGDGGNITIFSRGTIDTSSGTLTARSSSDSASSGEITLAAEGNIGISRLTSGTEYGNAGILTLFSEKGEILLNSDYDLSAVITNGNVKLGVFGKGNLGGSGVGIDLAGNGDAIMPGCLCEGWGVAGNGIAGGASASNDSPENLKLTAFSSNPSAATSRVTLSSLPSLQVTQAYLPALEAPTALFENRVTITNKGSETISDIRYTRAMDWDVPPNPFNEYVTIGGREGATNVLYSSNNGFSTVNPLEPKTYTSYYQRTADGNYVEKGAETVNTDFVDNGSGDHGSVFDLGFGDLASGRSKTFSIYYGATTSEATALGALANVQAEMYSLGQSSPSGSPGTFIFGFKGVGGEPITVDQPLDPVADIPITDGEAEVLEKNKVRAIFQLYRELRRTIRRRASVSKKPPATSPTTISISEKDANHIFRKSPGHLPVDTPANRQLLTNTASNPKNSLGSDKFGNQWYAEVRPDGTQVWVRVRNGQITNGGVNQTPKTYDPQTGLNKPKP